MRTLTPNQFNATPDVDVVKIVLLVVFLTTLLLPVIKSRYGNQVPRREGYKSFLALFAETSFIYLCIDTYFVCIITTAFKKERKKGTQAIAL